jgi:hypothetical protein
MSSQPEPAEVAVRLSLYANSPAERAAAMRNVVKRATTRDEEDQLLWMVGVHYKPDLGTVRRNPLHSARRAT